MPSIRPVPRVLANQYAKTRAEILLHRRFFEDLLIKLLDRDERNLLEAASLVRQVPARVREVKDLVKQGVRQWVFLQKSSLRPQNEYRAALQRAVRQLESARTPEKEERLDAYQSLLSGDLHSDLTKLSDELDDVIEHVQEKIEEHREEKKHKKEKAKVGAFLATRPPAPYQYLYPLYPPPGEQTVYEEESTHYRFGSEDDYDDEDEDLDDEDEWDDEDEDDDEDDEDDDELGLEVRDDF